MKMRHNSGTAETPEQIIEHISRLMAEAEAMLAGPVAQQGGIKMVELKERLADARERMNDLYSTTRENVVAGARYTDDKIREYPYYSIGIAAAVGVLLGAMMRRNDR